MLENTFTMKQINKILSEHTPSPEGTYRYSAVLIPLFEIENEIHILFCKRAMTLKSQPGDVCFPGGRREGDEGLQETALRETWEEIGVSPDNVEILGASDYVVTSYGSIIMPFVGLITGITIEDLKINFEEVDEIFTVPLNYFLTCEPEEHPINIIFDVPDNFPFEHIVGGKNYAWGKGRHPELFYFYGGQVIWGFTARVIRNFCKIIKNFNWEE